MNGSVIDNSSSMNNGMMYVYCAFATAMFTSTISWYISSMIPMKGAMTASGRTPSVIVPWVRTYIMVAFPSAGLCVILIISLCHNYEAVTGVVCNNALIERDNNIKNIVPSISACLSESPQKYIWRTVVVCYVVSYYILNFPFLFNANIHNIHHNYK